MTAAAAERPEHVSEAHWRMLAVESGLTPETIEQRGYRTVTGDAGDAELAALGFNLAQARTAKNGDVLLVPMYDITGAVVSHQIRPDKPRVKKGSGSPLKYETPASAGNRVDFPPAGLDRITDGVSPIWITEGAKTADALAQAGVGVLMLAGVWGFMARAALEQGTAVSHDLYGVPLQGRSVYLAYDSDVVTKAPVQDAERRLAGLLSNRGAVVQVVRIPTTDDGAKQGADDYLAAGGTLDELLATAQAPTAREAFDGKHPQVYAYDVAREGVEHALESADAFLLRPVDAEGYASGPAHRFSRDELRSRIVHLAGQRGEGGLPLSAATHAVSRISGEYNGHRVSLAADHVVQYGGATWVDMGTDCGHDVVRIGSDGWGYVPWPAVPQWVVRGEHRPVLAPPAPAEERSWSPLQALLDVDDEVFALVRVWLVSVLVVSRVPLLWWYGSAGSGKSTRAKLVNAVLGLPGLVNVPRNDQDALSRLLTSSWIMVDNLGQLDPSISNLWSPAVMDGRISTRELYTSRQRLVEGRWTGQVTSIADVRGALDDLGTRLLKIDVDSVTAVRPHDELLARFAADAGRIRGALFDDAAAVRKRLAEHGARAPGEYRFPETYTAAVVLDERHGTDTLHRDEVLRAGNEVVAERAETDAAVQWYAAETRRRGGVWEATASEMIEVQKAHLASPSVLRFLRDDDTEWPKDATRLSKWFGTSSGRLKALGVRYRKLKPTERARLHRLEVIVPDASPADELQRQGQRQDESARSERVSDATDATDTTSTKSHGEVERREQEEGANRSVLKEVYRESGAKLASERLVASETAPDQAKLSDATANSQRQLASVSVSDTAFGAGTTWLVPRDAEIQPTIAAPGSAAQLLGALVGANAGALVVDVETSGYPLGHRYYELRTVQLGTDRAALVIDVRGLDLNAPAAKFIRSALASAARVVAHNVTADVIPLIHAGYADGSLWDRVHDTMIRAKLCQPQSTDAGLKKLASRMLGTEAVAPEADKARQKLFTANKWLKQTTAATPIARSGWANVDPHDPVMLRYAAADVLDTALVDQRLPDVPAALLARERWVQRVTARVTERGIDLVPGTVAALRATHAAERDRLGTQLSERGVANPRAAQRLAERLIELGATLPRTEPTSKFPTGQWSTNEQALRKVAQSGTEAVSVAELVLAQRKPATLLSTFLEPYQALIEYGDGKARPGIYTLGADTGRMSSSNPNAQNVPKEGGIRACFAAPEGYHFISADFAGVELRVAAALSGCPNLRQLLLAGEDLHMLIAKQVWGPDATDKHRSKSKRMVFGRFYGSSIDGMAERNGVTYEVAEQVTSTLDALAPGLTAWSADLMAQVRSGLSHFPAYSGRVIHLDPSRPYAAPNYAIQGTARELLVDALIRWERTEFGGQLILPVHDETITLAPVDRAAEATAELVRCMTTELHGIPILAKASDPSPVWLDH